VLPRAPWYRTLAGQVCGGVQRPVRGCGPVPTRTGPDYLCGRTTLSSVVDEQNWLTLPDVAEATGLPYRTVRGYLRDRVLVAVRRGENRALQVPDGFLVPSEEPGRVVVLGSLRGTIMLLADSGFDDEEIVVWLLRHSEELNSTPLAALREGRTHAVRRAAQALAF